MHILAFLKILTFIYYCEELLIFCRHWWIQGGAASVHPLRVQILSFRHTNFMKHSHLGSWRPPMRLAPPLQEILDLPLVGVCYFINMFCTCVKKIRDKVKFYCVSVKNYLHKIFKKLTCLDDNLLLVLV